MLFIPGCVCVSVHLLSPVLHPHKTPEEIDKLAIPLPDRKVRFWQVLQPFRRYYAIGFRICNRNGIGARLMVSLILELDHK